MHILIFLIISEPLWMQIYLFLRTYFLFFIFCRRVLDFSCSTPILVAWLHSQSPEDRNVSPRLSWFSPRIHLLVRVTVGTLGPAGFTLFERSPKAYSFGVKRDQRHIICSLYYFVTCRTFDVYWFQNSGVLKFYVVFWKNKMHNGSCCNVILSLDVPFFKTTDNPL